MSMEQIQLRFIIKENSPLENVLKPETRFNPGNAKHAFLTELSQFSAGYFRAGLLCPEVEVCQQANEPEDGCGHSRCC